MENKGIINICEKYIYNQILKNKMAYIKGLEDREYLNPIEILNYFNNERKLTDVVMWSRYLIKKYTLGEDIEITNDIFNEALYNACRKFHLYISKHKKSLK